MDGKIIDTPDVLAAKAPPARAARAGLPKHSFPTGLSAVSDAVRSFLTTEFQAREVRVTKIAALTGTEGGWEAEAEILVPDLAIKTLGLALSQEVLERMRYLVQMDSARNVTGYEPLD